MDDSRQPYTASEPQLLGGNIELWGFHALDPGSMIVLKKIIGNYARKFSDAHASEKLVLSITAGGGAFALNGSVVAQGKEVSATHADQNVFFVVDSVLKKLEAELRR
jgi:hypothetical protein